MYRGVIYVDYSASTGAGMTWAMTASTIRECGAGIDGYVMEYVCCAVGWAGMEIRASGGRGAVRLRA